MAPRYNLPAKALRERPHPPLSPEATPIRTMNSNKLIRSRSRQSWSDRRGGSNLIQLPDQKDSRSHSSIGRARNLSPNALSEPSRDAIRFQNVLGCATDGPWHYRRMIEAPRLLHIPSFDGVDGFTISNRADYAPLQLPGSGRLSLEAIPPGVWPILLEKMGDTTRVYFQVFLSRLVICWQADEGSGEPSLNVAPPQFDTLFHEAKNMTLADPLWHWVRLKRGSAGYTETHLIQAAYDDVFVGLEQEIIRARHRATNATAFSSMITQLLHQTALRSGLTPLMLAKLVTPDPHLVGIDDPFLSLASPEIGKTRQILGAWASLTRQFSLALDASSLEQCAPPVICSLYPFEDTNTIRVRFAADQAARPQLQLQIAPAMIQAALRGERRDYGRTLESLKHLSPALARLNHEFRDGRQLAFSFGDTSDDPGLRFDRDLGSEEPLIPDLYLLAEIAKWEKAGRSLEIYKGPPFLEREKKLFWRGSTTGPFINSFEEFCANHRVQACLHTIRELPAHADCKIARIVQTPEEIRQDARQFLKEHKILSGIIDSRDFAQYQMFLDLPGNASAWGSSLRYLQGMLVFRVAHAHELLYYASLRPWEHFIPVAADLSDLKSGVEWALLHQHKAAKIASNGQAIMLEFLANGGAILQNMLRDNLKKARPSE